MPSVLADQLYRGRPYLILEDGLRHSLGWRDYRKAGPSFVVVRLSRLGAVKVLARFPLTEEGWAAAWRWLHDLDASAAAAVGTRIAKAGEATRLKEAMAGLNAESLACLRRVRYDGGSSGVPLARGQAYDVRFLGDRIMIGPCQSLDATVEMPYLDVETVEVTGPGQVSTPLADVLALVLGLALLGAVLGLILLGVLGLLLGAVLLGLVGALIGASWTKMETIVRVRTTNAEYNFLISDKSPDVLRTELSAPLMAIQRTSAALRNVTAARAEDTDDGAELASESIPDQLSKLASLLQDDLITRDEFEHIKARLITRQ